MSWLNKSFYRFELNRAAPQQRRIIRVLDFTTPIFFYWDGVPLVLEYKYHKKSTIVGIEINYRITWPIYRGTEY